MPYIILMEEDNTREIALQIFSKPPGRRNSIQLQLESTTMQLDTQEQVETFILNVLSLITLHGIDILFGHTNIMELTHANYDLIQEYVNSYGYQIVTRFDDEGNLVIKFEKIY